MAIFFRGGFGVHVDEDDLDRRLQRGELSVGAPERVVALAHEDPALQIDYGDGNATDLAHPPAFSWNAGRVVRRAQQSRLLVDVIEYLLLVKDVVPGGHHIYAGGEQVFGDSRRDRKPAGGVLDVRDHEIDLALRAQIMEPFFERATTAASNCITGHQNPYHFLLTFRKPGPDSDSTSTSLREDPPSTASISGPKSPALEVAEQFGN
jgi:hypothetical protein